MDEREVFGSLSIDSLIMFARQHARLALALSVTGKGEAFMDKSAHYKLGPPQTRPTTNSALIVQGVFGRGKN